MIPRLSDVVEAAANPGVRFRVGISLAGNIARSALSFLSGILVARALGAGSYGDLNFLLASMAAVASILDMGAGSAFYTFLSQRPRSRFFMAVYSAWMMLQFVVTVAVVAVLLPGATVRWLWVDHPRQLVILAFAATFLMNQAWSMLCQLAEARRKTFVAQIATIGQAAAHVALVAAGFAGHWLSVRAVLWLTVGEYLVLAACIGPRLVLDNIDETARDRESPRDVLRNFAVYCKPLVVYGWIAFIYAFADRWLLQRYAGSVQQGLFAVAQQFSLLGTLLTASMVKVLWKELAESKQSGDRARLERLYSSMAKTLYFAVAWLCCLLLPYSGELLAWTVGGQFVAARLSLMLMLIYPVHQSLGQVQATLMFAVEDTKLYSWIGVMGMLVSIPVTYLLLAPPAALVPGFGLGAVGLAMKLVGMNILGVAVTSVVVRRRHGCGLSLTFQAVALTTLLLAAALSKWTAAWIAAAAGTANPIAVLIAGAAIYAAVTAAIVLQRPALVGADFVPRAFRLAAFRPSAS